ncbi:MAG TPA: hydroxyisourate hydrolase [Terriglobia bacterium]|nr:hydroxyisourate hydrolase [Terriglobia bacterium]
MGISTHVLDTSLGRPASAMPVHLERRSPSGAWQTVASGETDSDGRCRDLVPSDDPLSPGVYRITFDTERYFDALEVDGLYPVVTVTFMVREAAAHYHIPLLVSPNGYTTYRGS